MTLFDKLTIAWNKLKILWLERKRGRLLHQIDALSREE
jgi:hypothetical protein